MKKNIAALALMFMMGVTAFGRTIILTAEDCDQMAFISAAAPRVSWANIQIVPGVFDAAHQTQIHQNMALLMRFPLDQIPKDQRILKAELTMPVTYVAGKARIQTRRLLAEWGTGVCHQYRRTFPKKEEWSQPGGRGAGTDRANKDSAVFKVDVVGANTVDVTEDVELWYTGAALNRGWIMSLEELAGPVYCESPYGPQHASGKQWKLQITFEPK